MISKKNKTMIEKSKTDDIEKENEEKNT